MAMRHGLDGAEAAARWQSAAAVGSPIFVLRDALFSQPDNPVEQRPYALMMPPNWVTAATADVAAGRSLEPLVAPAIDDDSAWQAIPSAAAMFGSFPPSRRLFELAHADRTAASPSERKRIENARASVRSLAVDTKYLIAAAARGHAAVAATGAARIDDSDLRYFGVGRRQAIVIAVENPNLARTRRRGQRDRNCRSPVAAIDHRSGPERDLCAAAPKRHSRHRALRLIAASRAPPSHSRARSHCAWRWPAPEQ